MQLMGEVSERRRMQTPSTSHSAAVESNVSSYALDALEATERQRFERHLAECAVCRRLVDEDRQLAGYLALLVPQHDPDPMLRARIVQSTK
jgi:anti-sigma factor RsiW